MRGPRHRHVNLNPLATCPTTVSILPRRRYRPAESAAMHDGRPHPLLAQVPLTVSPFVSLPTATTLPYTYKTLPSTLPPSSTGETNGVEKPKYVISASGHAANPDDIVASCQMLQTHLQKMQDDAERTLKEWDERIHERELAEKRRLAPGWLDREEKILEPEKAGASKSPDAMQDDALPGPSVPVPSEDSREGEELDRAFGTLGIRS